MVLLIGAYLYLLNSSVFAVANRRDLNEKVVELEAEVSTMEANYLGQISNVNLDLAKKLGFVDAIGRTGFASKNQPLGLLAVNNEI